jgi:hypothetical protein
MDPVCGGGSDSHLARYLDVTNIGYQRFIDQGFINQARKKLWGTAKSW